MNTSLVSIQQGYLEWCWDQEDIQRFWRKEWKSESGELFSNINPGDRFSLGTHNQIGIVYKKVIWLQEHLGKPNTHEYHIGGDIGGHWSHPMHEHMAEGYFLWIPTIDQLIVLGHISKADELFSLTKYRANPAPIVEQYLSTCERFEDADRQEKWKLKHYINQELDALEKIMKDCGITIDEREDPLFMKNPARADDERIFTFHVRTDNVPWKAFDLRTKKWSTYL